MKPHVMVIGTGGTIASLGRHSLDYVDYGLTDQRLSVGAMLGRIPELAQIARLSSIDCGNLSSVDIGYATWKPLAQLCRRVAAEDASLAGIVITHGTCSMEESAFFLDLWLDLPIPVVLTGSQRPFDALATDAPLNLLQAVQVAATPAFAGCGVLLAFGGEVHAARGAVKRSASALAAFETPALGPLGLVEAGAARRFHAPARPRGDASFAAHTLPAALPRVDIVYSHADADAVAIDAFVAAGARGIVAAGFLPGYVTSKQEQAVARASEQGVLVVQAMRRGSGDVAAGEMVRRTNMIAARRLSVEKARILLASALGATHDARGRDLASWQALFDAF
jgi:L-asparaginase